MSTKAVNRVKSPDTLSPANVPVDALPLVELDADKIQQALRLAKKRNESYKPINGGLVFGSQDSLTSHQVGVIGELAFAKFYGLEIDSDTYERGDEGWDHQLLGARIDVKSTATQAMERPELLVKEGSDLEADRFVLAHITHWNSSGATVRIVGWASRSKVANQEPEEHPGDNMNYVVPPSELDLLPHISPSEI